MHARSLCAGCTALLLTLASGARAQTGVQPPPGQPAPADGFSAGGLAPPPPMTGGPSQPGTGYPTETQRQLDQAETEDSGRELEWIYVNVEGGVQYLGLETFKSDGLTYGDAVASKAAGPVIGAGAGIRVIFLTFGARARHGMFADWKATTVDAEMGVHVPIGAVEPHFTFAAGYAFLNGMDADSWGGDATIRGWNARIGAGLDYYVTPVFSVGGDLTGDALFLSRPGIDIDPAAQGASGSGALDSDAVEVAKDDGSSIGGAVTATLVLGLHF